jgi:uncharacterized protein YndB with AHSA1/START domain
MTEVTGMIRVAKTMHIARSPEDVFNFLADASREVEWNTTAISVARVSDGPLGQGSRFCGNYKRIGQLDSTITAYDWPRKLGFRSEGRALYMDFTFTFTPEPGGTQIQALAEIRLRGPLRLLEPFMGGMMDREFSTREPAIKRALEGVPGSAVAEARGA